MKEIRVRNPREEATALLDMDTKQAALIFQRYTSDEQLAIIETVPDPKKREELYYLVPDCTDLVQSSPTESVMQMALVYLGTGQSTGILSAASSEQLSEIFDLVAYQNGTVDQKRLEAWLMEMLHCGDDVFEKALQDIDAYLLGEFFKDRLSLEPSERFDDDAIPYVGWVVEEALVNPEDLSYDTEDTALLVEMIYATDGDLFQTIMEYIFLQDLQSAYEWEMKTRKIRETVKARVESRDRDKGVTEESLQKLVDLDNIELSQSKPDTVSSKKENDDKIDDLVMEANLQKLVDLDEIELKEGS